MGSIFALWAKLRYSRLDVFFGTRPGYRLSHQPSHKFIFLRACNDVKLPLDPSLMVLFSKFKGDEQLEVTAPGWSGEKIRYLITRGLEVQLVYSDLFEARTCSEDDTALQTHLEQCVVVKLKTSLQGDGYQ